MPIRVRKLIGAVVTILFVIFYALMAMAVAQARFIQEAPNYVQPFLYAILGMGWMLPMMPLIKWMEGGGRTAPASADGKAPPPVPEQERRA